jgi:hypothetical protein
MNRISLIALALAAGLCLVPATSFAQPVAKRIAIRFSPLPERVATADAVVAGKVTGIEDKTVSAEPAPGVKDKVEYEIAVVKVEDGILGTKGLTHVKVGTVKVPEGKPIIRPGGGAPQKLTVDQEGVFFLHKHPTESFYVLQGPMSVVNKAGNDNYEKELARVKECAKLLADPKAGLKAKSADDRALTAGMLVLRYNTPRPGETKREAIDADQSKLILTALAEAEWNPKRDPNMAQNELLPQAVFGRLGLTDKDGWNAAGPFNTQNAYEEAAKSWLKGHADSYRVQRFVGDKKDEKKDK